jgi:YgiT-type zinc finger domain-containing protein
MKCVFCGHDLKRMKKDIEQNLNGNHIIIKDVPVYMCENCAEEYYDDSILDEIEKLVKNQKAVGEKLLPIYKFKEEAASIA